MTNYIKTFLLITALLLFRCTYASAGADGQSKPNPGQAVETSRYTAYYFHTNFRCTSCKRIETWSHEAVTSRFAGELKSGSLQWQAINVEEPGNEHYVQEFNLYTKALVIVETAGGKPVRWENLDKVWQHLQDQKRFSEYVTVEVAEFMEKK